MKNEEMIEITGCQVVILLASVKGGRKPRRRLRTLFPKKEGGIAAPDMHPLGRACQGQMFAR